MRRTLLSVSEIAEILGITVDRTYSLSRAGILPVVHLGRQIRIDPEQFEEWIKNGGQAFLGGWKYEKK